MRAQIHPTGCISFRVLSKRIIISRQNRIEHNSGDCRNGKRGKGDGSASNRKGQPIRNPRPETKITPAIIRFLDFVKSTWFSTTFLTPIAEIIP